MTRIRKNIAPLHQKGGETLARLWANIGNEPGTVAKNIDYPK
jgi:hypothetical protein